MKKFMLSTLTLTLGLSLAACGDSAEDVEDTENTQDTETTEETGETGNDTATENVDSEANQELNWALAVDPDGLDPHMTTAASTFQISHNIYDTLVNVTPEGEYVPGLAEEWDISEDGQTITFYLEEDVLFHDGSDFNAEDVVYSFERLQSDSSARSADYEGLTEFSSLDDYTVEFNTAELDVNLLGKFAYPWAAIVPEGADDDLTNNPVGTGPYVLENWVPQQNLTLTKYEDYWGEPAYIQTVNFRSMPDTTSQITSMLAGELDVIGITGDLVNQFEGQDGFEITEEPANALQLMAFNTDHEALADERVRQAITLAVDKDALIDTVWYGYGDKIGSHYPPILRGYVDHSESLSYDPEAALELLEEAGYPNGEGLELDMYLPSAYPAYVSAGQVIADYLTELGITINIQNVEWAVWLSDVYTARNYDLTVTGHTGRLDPYSLLARYHTDSPENYMNYSNERVNELLENVQVEQDEAARGEIYEEIQNILAEEVPGLYIQAPIGLRVTDENIEGLETYPIDIIELKDVHFVE